MKYDVIVDTDNSAVIETLDVDNNQAYLYFTIGFTGEGVIENGKGIYSFGSMATLPPSYGDPRGYELQGRNFHGKSAVQRTIDGSSLDEACRKFFEEWGDSYRLTGRLKQNQ